jgi:hypothetical protein
MRCKRRPAYEEEYHYEEEPEVTLGDFSLTETGLLMEATTVRE